jgi:hypothetical protein
MNSLEIKEIIFDKNYNIENKNSQNNDELNNEENILNNDSQIYKIEKLNQSAGYNENENNDIKFNENLSNINSNDSETNEEKKIVSEQQNEIQNLNNENENNNDNNNQNENDNQNENENENENGNGNGNENENSNKEYLKNDDSVNDISENNSELENSKSLNKVVLDEKDNSEDSDKIEELETPNNIKSIIFSNKNEINNIVFNNIENENITKFIANNQNLVIEEEVALKESEIIYKDDIVYLKELETQLLSTYPVVKYSDKYIQELVETEAKKIIEIKNIGILENEMFEKGIEYKLIYNMLYDKFNKKVIIPIISDKHKIYVKLKEESNNQNNEEEDKKENLNMYFSESLEDKKGIIEENQKNQMITLKELYHNKAIGKIDYKKYLNEVSDITKPYTTSLENMGYIKRFKDETLVLRYNDINSVHWNTYNVLTEFRTIQDVLDEKGKIQGIEEKILIKGEDANVVGFMLLSTNTNSIKKEFKKIGTINKIYNTQNSITIDSENHGINKEDIIFIGNTNCYPPINNIFSKSVEIVDKNTIKLYINLKLIKDGTEGEIYKLSKLEYDLYDVKKEKNEINIEYKSSTYNKKNSKKEENNKVYIFNNINVNKEDYQNIIRMIMPSLNNLIELKKNKLEKIYTFQDFNNIFSKYDLTINQFNINQISVIKQYFSNNLKKMIESNIESKGTEINLNLFRNNKKLFELEYFLANEYIKDKNIENLYGVYPYFNKPEDNIILRLKWINSMSDNGNYYFLNYLIKQKDEINNVYINNKKKELNNLLKDLEKSFNKERENTSDKSYKMYKYQAYVISDKDGSEEAGFPKLKGVIEKGTVVFYKDDLYYWEDKLKKMEDVEENSLALVGKELWVYKKGSWVKSIAVPKYDNIAYLCMLNNMDVKDLKLDSLDCVYRKEFGCQSKLYIRLDENIKRIKKDLENFNKLEEYLEQKDKNIKEMMDDIKIKYFSYIDEKYNVYNKKNKKLNKKEKIEKEESKIENVKVLLKQNKNKNERDSLSILLNLIKDIKEDDLRLHYIYTLIDRDGILINNSVYSKKYGRDMNICGHYIYFKEINYANNPDDKNKIIEKMLNIYSDDGYSEKNVHTCKNCGEMIGINDYDETEGFAESGALKKSREIWKAEKESITMEKFDLFEQVKLSDLDESSMKEILIRQGLTIEDVDSAIKISIFITKNLFPKSGVYLSNQSILNIIIDCMQKIKSIIPYSIYKSKEIKKLQDKGVPMLEIEKIDLKGKFKEGYENYNKIRKSSIITARFLIEVQTAVPNLVRTSKSTICPFYSFDGEEGLIYMSCILQEMGLISLKDKVKAMEIIKVSLQDSYDEFKNLVHIKKLFKLKKSYLLEISKKKEIFKFIDENATNNKKEEEKIIEPIEISKNYDNILKKEKNVSNINKLKKVLLDRLLFLSKSIKKSVKDVIVATPTSDLYSGLLETSCCQEEAETYLGYYYFIENLSDITVKKYIDESHLLYDLLKYYIQTGTIHKFLFYDKFKFDGIYNYAIVDDQVNTSESLIKAVFENYVPDGQYAGTMREYVGGLDSQIDIKTGMTKSEILNKTYTIEDYEKLMREIEKQNIKLYKPYEIFEMEKVVLDDLKKNSYDKLDEAINNLVKNVANMLDKNKEYIEKNIKLMRNMGMFDNNLVEKDDKNITEKEKIKYRQNLNKSKLDYLKKFYISVLKKNLAFIKYGSQNKFETIDLSYSGDEQVGLEMQSYIYNQYQKIEPFLKNEIKEYFMNLETIYSNEEINSINGMDNIYDSKFEKIKKYSDFNFQDASNVLLYIIVGQLNSFISCGIKEKEEYNENNFIGSEKLKQIDNKNVKCRYICLFIDLLFEYIDNDYEIFDVCKKGSEDIKNNLIHDILEYKVKEYYKEEKTDYELQKIKKDKFIGSINELGEENEKAEGEYIENLETNEKEYYVIEKAKKALFEKYGYEPTETEINNYKNEYMDEIALDMDIEKDLYNYSTDPKKEEVIDQGNEYGTFNEFDFETGEGFDYSAEEE